MSVVGVVDVVGDGVVVEGCSCIAALKKSPISSSISSCLATPASSS